MRVWRDISGSPSYIFHRRSFESRNRLTISHLYSDLTKLPKFFGVFFFRFFPNGKIVVFGQKSKKARFRFTCPHTTHGARGRFCHDERFRGYPACKETTRKKWLKCPLTLKLAGICQIFPDFLTKISDILVNFWPGVIARHPRFTRASNVSIHASALLLMHPVRLSILFRTYLVLPVE